MVIYKNFSSMVVSHSQTAFFHFFFVGAEKGSGVTPIAELVLTTIQFLEMLIGADGWKRSINKVRMTRYTDTTYQITVRCHSHLVNTPFPAICTNEHLQKLDSSQYHSAIRVTPDPFFCPHKEKMEKSSLATRD